MSKIFKKNTNYRKRNIKTFINKSNIIHNNKYIYDKVKYVNDRTNIIITCLKHGDFLQTPNSHLRGRGCKLCSYEKRSFVLSSTTNQFITKAKNIHRDKYDYSLVEYINNHKKIKIICPTHGIFLQIPYNHLCGKGCIKCSSRSSKKAGQWLSQFKNIEIEYPIKINNKRYIVDGFNKTTNTIYEFWGDFWHGNPKFYNKNDINPINKKTFGELYDYTLNKIQNLKSAGFNIISIWESEWE